MCLPAIRFRAGPPHRRLPGWSASQNTCQALAQARDKGMQHFAVPQCRFRPWRCAARHLMVDKIQIRRQLFPDRLCVSVVHKRSVVVPNELLVLLCSHPEPPPCPFPLGRSASIGPSPEKRGFSDTGFFRRPHSVYNDIGSVKTHFSGHLLRSVFSLTRNLFSATKVRARIVRWNRLSSTNHLCDPQQRSRGRDAGCPAPPAQIRTCSFPACGSYLGCLASKRK
jgi:hypothetical protein